MKLFHYCCSHSVPGIRRDRTLKPNPHPWLPIPLVWLTDLEEPHREGLGLTSETLRCDRTEYRVTVDAEAERWVRFARPLGMETRAVFETTPGVLPMHWFVSTSPVPVLAVDDLRGAS